MQFRIHFCFTFLSHEGHDDGDDDRGDDAVTLSVKIMLIFSVPPIIRGFFYGGMS